MGTRRPLLLPRAVLLLLLLFAMGGGIEQVVGENISIQYVIVHSTSTGDLLSGASSARPPTAVFTATATAVATATSVTSSVGGGGGGGGGDGGASEYAPVVAPSSLSASLLRMPMREASFAVTYEHQIPGQPGKDYPIHAQVPGSAFDCRHYHQAGGYFADEHSGCQVIHICQEDGSRESFLCPNGTIFNQQYLVCDWWFNVDCSKSRSFYTLNNADLSDTSRRQQPSNRRGNAYSAHDASAAQVTSYGDDHSGPSQHHTDAGRTHTRRRRANVNKLPVHHPTKLAPYAYGPLSIVDQPTLELIKKK